MLTHADMLQLKHWNTPTVYNGCEQITTDLDAQKSVLQGRVAFQSFILPDNRTVQDEENLTADWLRRISEGGGFSCTQVEHPPRDRHS